MGIRATRPTPEVVSGCRSVLAAVTATLGSAVQSPANAAAAAAWTDMIWADLKSFLRSECSQISKLFYLILLISRAGFLTFFLSFSSHYESYLVQGAAATRGQFFVDFNFAS